MENVQEIKQLDVKYFGEAGLKRLRSELAGNQRIETMTLESATTETESLKSVPLSGPATVPPPQNIVRSPGTARFYTVSSGDARSSPAAKPVTGTVVGKPVFSFLPKMSSFLPLTTSQQDIQHEALHFMRGVMDECTHLGNFSKPVDTGLVIIIAARSDAYIPRDSVLSLEKLWPGAEVRYIDSGHITAFLFKQNIFRSVGLKT